MKSLTERVVSGGFWITGVKVAEKIFNWIRLIILARILAPDDFGQMGIALLAMGVLETFSNTGFSAALIQKKGKTKEYLASAWTVSVFRGIILFVLLYSIADFTAAFFGSSESSILIKLIAFSMLSRGLTNIKVIYFAKELKFHKHFIYFLSGSAVDFVVTIVLAIILQSPLALVIGLVAGSITRMLASFLIAPWKPKFEFNLKKSSQLFVFGKWILISNLLSYLLIQGDSLFVGKIFGAEDLGIYQMAFRFASILSVQFAFVIAEVTFPAYSKIQDNIPKLKNAYLRVLKFSLLFALPFAALMFSFAEEFTMIILGEQWLGMVPVLQVLAIGSILRLFSEINGVLFRGMGKPKIQTLLSVLALVMIAGIIYPLSFYFGLVGAALSVTIPYILINLLEVLILRKMLSSRFLQFIKRLSPPIIGMLLVFLLGFVLKSLLPKTLIYLLGAGFAAMLIYLITILVYSKFDTGYLKETKLIEIEKISSRLLSWKKIFW